MSEEAKKIDLMYVEGAGKTIESLRRWLSGEDFVSESSKTFSGQVFEFCRKHDFSTLVVSSQPESAEIKDENFNSIVIPKRLYAGRLGYHVSQLLHGFKILLSAIRHRPRYLHITSGATYLFVLSPLKLLNIKIFPHFHNTFWPKGFPPVSRVSKILNQLDGWFLRNIASGALCCSMEVCRQVQLISGRSGCPAFVFKCQFNQSSFALSMPVARERKLSFDVMYAGRIERDKGVFDFIEMADRLKGEPVLFHVCGEGSSLDELKRQLTERGLESTVKIYGKLNRAQLVDVYTLSDVVVVPTTKNFPEGLAMVAVEAVLLGKPVVASSVVPATEALSGAVVEVAAGDIDGYVATIKKLMADEGMYEKMQDACIPLRSQFFDGRDGLTNVLRKTLIN